MQAAPATRSGIGRARSEAGRAGAREDQQQHDRGGDQPVPDEDRVVVAAHVAEQRSDREQAAPGGRERADDERPRRARAAGRRAARPARPCSRTAPSMIGTSRKNEKRAAESRSRPRNRPAVIVIPERETPGISARLCAAPIASASRGPSAPIRRRSRLPVGDPEQPGEDDEDDRDLPRLPQMLGDQVLPQERRRSRPGPSRRRRTTRSARRPSRPGASAACPQPGRQQADEVAPEVGDDRDERPQVERDVERLVEGVVLLEVLPVAEPRARGSGGRTRRSAGARSHPGRAPGSAPASSGARSDRPPLRAASGRPRPRWPCPRRSRLLHGPRRHPTVRRASRRPEEKLSQFAAITRAAVLLRPSGPARFLLQGARSAIRSKPSSRAVRGSGKSAGSVDESATGSLNFFAQEGDPPSGSLRARSLKLLGPAAVDGSRALVSRIAPMHLRMPAIDQGVQAGAVGRLLLPPALDRDARARRLQRDRVHPLARRRRRDLPLRPPARRRPARRARLARRATARRDEPAARARGRAAPRAAQQPSDARRVALEHEAVLEQELRSRRASDG